ncbi:hypothetical protein SDC9_62231 [bioreactor metagenome]|uniref:Uncharacterized protein n=1 Tax=bioreactor metagenome TaxID=1076179 RepID=A0A644XIS8_9ZZZZ
MPCIDVQGHAILFSEVAQDRLFFRGGRVLPQGPHTAEGVAADEVVGTEFNDGGRYHVEKILNTDILLRRRVGFRLFCHRAFFLSELILNIKKPPQM